MKATRLFLSVAVALILTACGTTAPVKVTATQIVKVQVPVYCEVKDVAKPEMPFDEKARSDMDIFEKTKLLGAQDKNLKGYVKELEGALAGCKSVTENTKK